VKFYYVAGIVFGNFFDALPLIIITLDTGWDDAKIALASLHGIRLVIFGTCKAMIAITLRINPVHVMMPEFNRGKPEQIL
jgi:hypothetical protein